jgi:hypothetical protein
MRVIHRQTRANGVAVVEDDRASDVGIVGQFRMAERTTPCAAWLAHQRADEIEVVNRMHHDLETWHGLEKRPISPRRVKVDAHFEVGHLAEDAAHERVLERKHVGRKAKLKIDRGQDSAFAANRADATRVGEIAAHRFLDHHRGAGRDPLDDSRDMNRWYRDVEDDTGRLPRGVERSNTRGMPNAAARSRPASLFASKIPATGKPSRP